MAKKKTEEKSRDLQCWSCKEWDGFEEAVDGRGHPYLMCKCGASTVDYVKKDGKWTV